MLVGCLVTKSCPTLVTPWTVAHQAPLSPGFPRPRILGWVATSFSRGSSRPRDQTCVSCIAGRIFTFTPGLSGPQTLAEHRSWLPQREIAPPLPTPRDSFPQPSRGLTPLIHQPACASVSPPGGLIPGLWRPVLHTFRGFS